MEKKISIIVAAYNVKPYIDKCLKSIIAQTYNNLEIIVVDDGSIDGTEVICDEFAVDERVRVIHRKNGGLSAARNSGLDFATGYYVCFVDGDDYIKDSYCYELIEVAESNSADIVMFSYFRDYGERVVPYINGGEIYIINQEEAIKELVKDNKIKSMACMKFYKRELFETIRFKEKHYFEDVYLMHHLFLKAKIFVIFNKPLYYYLFREGSISNDQGKLNLAHRFESIQLRFTDIEEKFPQIRDLLVEKTAYTYVDIYNSICAGKYEDQAKIKDMILEFIKNNKRQLSFKVKTMFFIVRLFKIVHLNKFLYILMKKILN